MEAFGTACVFDLPIRRAVDRKALSWPTAAELRDPDCALGGNHVYEDLTWVRWSHARGMLATESSAVALVMASDDPRAAAARLHEEHQRVGELQDHPLWGMDLGVASAAYALAAFGAIPVMSCNGGAFGGFHRGDHPYVACYVRKNAVGRLLEWAAQAGVGLIGVDDRVVLYANRIEALLGFAKIGCEAEGPLIPPATSRAAAQ